MNVATIECDARLAAEKYQEYLKATERTPEDEQCKRIYRAIAKGKRVLNLCEAMRLAGTDHFYRPKVAIARAGTRTSVDFSWYPDWDSAATKHPVFGDAHGGHAQYSYNYKEGVFGARIVLPEWTFPRDQKGRLGKLANDRDILGIHAAIPPIPTNLRPPRAKQKLYHIFWEVDEWKAGVTRPTQSRDPLLLKHIGAWFFVIVAAWDLTDIERTVHDLSMTRRM